ncbi:MAG: hypothetical protein JSW54_04100, partial [Fidelibacterota bacterium]
RLVRNLLVSACISESDKPKPSNSRTARVDLSCAGSTFRHANRRKHIDLRMIKSLDLHQYLKLVMGVEIQLVPKQGGSGWKKKRSTGILSGSLITPIE